MTAGTESALSAAEWLSGINRGDIFIFMCFKDNEHDLNSFPLPLKLKHIVLDCPAFNVENSFMK